MIHNFDPYEALQQLGNNQKQLDENSRNIVVVVNNLQQIIQDHERRLDLNQATINQILASLQNQQKLVLALLDKINELSAVNSAKGHNLNDQTSSSTQG
jgi:hypothetical protein